MFSNHLILNVNEEPILYLFVDFNYEFSSDFKNKNKKEKVKTLYEKATDYIKEKKINFKMGKVMLVVGSLVVGSLFINNYKYSSLKDQLEPSYQYVEQVDIFENNIIEEKANTQADVKNDEVDNSNVVINQKPTVVDKEATNSSSANVVTPPTNNVVIPPVVNVTTPTENAVVPPTIETPQEPVYTEPAIAEETVTLYRYNGTVQEISLEDYVVGVVAAEMPASFNVEALKAQSVLARTYALKK
ncbi:MAG: SpoIID/LytB domain-containing protein, partial [Bacilli bacterium]